MTIYFSYSSFLFPLPFETIKILLTSRVILLFSSYLYGLTRQSNLCPWLQLPWISKYSQIFISRLAFSPKYPTLTTWIFLPGCCDNIHKLYLFCATSWEEFPILPPKDFSKFFLSNSSVIALLQMLIIFCLNFRNSLLNRSLQLVLVNWIYFSLSSELTFPKMQIWTLSLSLKHFHWLLFSVGQNSNSLVGHVITLIDDLSPAYPSRYTLPLLFSKIWLIVARVHSSNNQPRNLSVS